MQVPAGRTESSTSLQGPETNVSAPPDVRRCVRAGRLSDKKSPRLRDADSISGPIRLCGAADPVELGLRNNTDIGPHIVATNANIPEFDAISQAASMKKRARWAPSVFAS
jgi:hypothetical protein